MPDHVRPTLEQLYEQIRTLGELEQQERGTLTVEIIDRVLEDVEYYRTRVRSGELLSLNHIHAALHTRRRQLNSPFYRR